MGEILFSILCYGQENEKKESNVFMTKVYVNLVNVEPGISFQYIFNNRYYTSLSYGHTFFGFHIISHGGYGSSFKYWPYQGDNLRLGIGFSRTHILSGKENTRVELRATFRQMKVPKHCTRHGSNGLTSVLREIISEDRKYAAFQAFGITDYRILSRLNLQLFFGLGYQYCSATIHKYSRGTSGGCTEKEYPPNTYEQKDIWIPRIDFGVLAAFDLYSRFKKRK